MNKTKFNVGRGWAWELKEGPCYWAEPTLGSLKYRPKPSTEAKPIRVVIIRAQDYRKLLKMSKD